MLSASSASLAHHRPHVAQEHTRALGLTRSPFPVTPDDEQAFFFSPRLHMMYEELKHFIHLRKGFMLVTGDVGVGKTTLTRLLLGHLKREQVKTALIINSFLQDIEILRAINRDFCLAPEEDTLEGHLECLNTFLLDVYKAGNNCVLIFDDAQRLGISSLELIRQLSNLETEHDKLIQIVLVAQPEIMDTLNRFDLRQLRSRIALHVELQPFTLQEIDQYLHHRLSVAGSNNSISVSAGAMRELFRASGGYARIIHLVMDRCLFGLVAKKIRLIDTQLMKQAIDESSLHQAATAPRWGRAPATSGAAVAVSFVSMLAIGLAVVASASWQEEGAFGKKHERGTSLPIPGTPSAVRDTPPAIAANQVWQDFLDAYPGLNGVVITEFQDISHAGLEALEKALAPYHWIPVVVGSTELSSCAGYPSFRLRSASGQKYRLVLFQTDLPYMPVPFSQAGASVKLLQTKLSALGYMAGAKVDGVMGGRTAAALARFQKARGLVGTGQPDIYSSYALECTLSQNQVWLQ